jgi:hypothetical protein
MLQITSQAHQNKAKNKQLGTTTINYREEETRPTQTRSVAVVTCVQVNDDNYNVHYA